MNFKIIGFKGVDWIQPAEGREQWRDIMHAVIRLPVLCKTWQSLRNAVTFSFSWTLLKSMNRFRFPS